MTPEFVTLYTQRDWGKDAGENTWRQRQQQWLPRPMKISKHTNKWFAAEEIAITHQQKYGSHNMIPGLVTLYNPRYWWQEAGNNVKK